tara:strand:- start:2 stop:256 length:255 start_codon:yes stop_codon:yes gene_type:complete
MSRKIKINKYQGNTHYSVHVVDSFNQEHHIGYFKLITEVSQKIIDEESNKIWSNEVKREPCLMSKAIKNCIEIDIKNGMIPILD